MRTIFKHIMIAALLLAASGTSAQISGQSAGMSAPGYGDVLVITTSPKHPKPYDNVGFKLESSTADLKIAEITWKVDGVVRSSGIGATTFSMTVGGIGSRAVVTAEVVSSAGRRTSTQTTIKPSRIDLIWEADTYTPPFYKGKASYSRDSELRVVAIPHVAGLSGAEVSASNLVYTWKANGIVQYEQSGYGKNELSIPTNYLNQAMTVEVVVSTIGGESVGAETLAVRPTAPKVLVYENHPLYGIRLGRALIGDAELTSKEISLVAYPYNFSVLPGRLTYDWMMNGTRVAGDEDGSKITFRNADDSSGRSSISLSVKNPDKLFQFTETSFGLHYESAEDNQPFI